MPAVRALPTSESSSGARYSGKIETTSMRISGLRLTVVGQQTARGVQHDATADDIDHRHDRSHERHQGAGARRLTDDEHVMRGQVLDVQNGAHRATVDVLDPEPRQLVRVPRVLLGRVGGGPVENTFEQDEPAAVLAAGPLDRQWAGARRNGTEDGSGGEALVGRVAAEVDGHLAAHPVGAADARDGQLHGSSGWGERPVAGRWGGHDEARSTLGGPGLVMSAPA